MRGAWAKPRVSTGVKMPAAIYARVSDDTQNYEMQLTEVRDYAQRMGWAGAVEYTEKMSAGKSRPVLARLMADARLRKIDAVLVWKLDRFGRSVSNIIENILLLDSFGVRLIAVTQGIDTDQKSPANRLMIHILAAVAEFERSMIIDRVRSGMAQAKREGKHCGRPRPIWRRDEAVKLRAKGLSFRTIAAKIGQPESSIRRALKSAPKG
jgi:putative DNA-invertase from lambdoid prophage Rac